MSKTSENYSDSSSDRKVEYSEIIQERNVRVVSQYVTDSPEERRLVRKIDLKLMPILWLMSIVHHVGQANLANAHIAGMGRDLRVHDNRYAYVISVYFLGYLAFAIPSGMVISRLRPSVVLPLMLTSWGIITCLIPLTQHYRTVLIFRAILGATQAGFFPGVIYLVSCWYRNHEIGKRIASLFAAAMVGNAIAGLVSSVVAKNLRFSSSSDGWRYIFVIEGAVAVLIGGLSSVVLLDTPATSKSLNIRERELAVARVVKDGREPGHRVDLRLTNGQALLAAVLDPITWSFSLLYLLNVSASSVSFFIPSLMRVWGYSYVSAQYMVVPVYLAAYVLTLALSAVSDRRSNRQIPIAVASLIGAVGALISTANHSRGGHVAMLSVTASFVWATGPIILTWAAESVPAPSEKRAIVLAIVYAVGGLGNIAGSGVSLSGFYNSFTIGWLYIVASLLAVILVAFLAGVVSTRRWPKYQGTKIEKEILVQRAVEAVIEE